MKKMKNRILISILAFLLFGQGCTGPEAKEGYIIVRKVIDGDTFILDDTERGTHVRIIGLDAPESRKTRYEDVQPYGAEAKAFLIDLLEGKNVKLEYGVEPKDKYGRTLAYIFLEDGTFVNELILKEGFARISTYPPNVKYVEQFVAAQKEAREAHKGMWK